MKYLLAVLCFALSACGGGRGAGYAPAPDPTPTPGVTAADLQHCVDVINQHRATVGKPALARSTALEQVAAAAASNDFLSGVPHQYFQRTNGGGLAVAENEFPGSISGGVQPMIDLGIRLFWSEGPSGGHYQNMVGPYTQVGCGVHIDGNASLLAIDFR